MYCKECGKNYPNHGDGDLCRPCLYIERVEKATNLLIKYGYIDGSHHKMWVIDQTLRTLLGSYRYKELCNKMISEGYKVDIGIAP